MQVKRMTGGKVMASNLSINENLLNNAFLIGGYSSKKETVNTALQEFIQRRKSEEKIRGGMIKSNRTSGNVIR